MDTEELLRGLRKHVQEAERANADLRATYQEMERRIRLDEHEVLIGFNEPGVTCEQLVQLIGQRREQLQREGQA